MIDYTKYFQTLPQHYITFCGSNGRGRTVGLDDPVGPSQPCDSMILWCWAVQGKGGGMASTSHSICS